MDTEKDENKSSAAMDVDMSSPEARMLSMKEQLENLMAVAETVVGSDLHSSGTVTEPHIATVQQVEPSEMCTEDKLSCKEEAKFQWISCTEDPGFKVLDAVLEKRKSLTQENYDKILEMKKRLSVRTLQQMCENLSDNLTEVVKDRTDGLFFKLDNLRFTSLEASLSECVESYFRPFDIRGKPVLQYAGPRLPKKSCVLKVYEVIKEYVESSGRLVGKQETIQGYWKSFLIISNYAGQCMVVADVHLDNISKADKWFEEVQPQLREFFEKGPVKDTGVVSVHLRVSNFLQKRMLYHLCGEKHLEEHVGDLKLNIYSTTVLNFFHGIPLLFDTMAEMLEIKEETAVITLGVTDIISMFMAKRCRVVHSVRNVASTSQCVFEDYLKSNGIDNVVIGELSAIVQPTSEVCAIVTDVCNSKISYTFCNCR